jgi:DNA-binding response OmpR family regulator
MDVILAVDSDVNVNKNQSAEWAKYDIDTVRVDTVGEALMLLARGKDYFFIAVNEDSVPDFLSWIPLLRDATNLPIFVITSSYTVVKKIAALNSGVDVYEPFNSLAQDNVLAAFAQIKAHNRRANLPQKQSSLLVFGNVILSANRRVVFVNNNKVYLNKKEFDLLRYLMENDGCAVTHETLLESVWKDNGESGPDVLWRTIDRLRRKLAEASFVGQIQTERGIGYRFIRSSANRDG